jgi:hypothetical protein
VSVLDKLSAAAVATAQANIAAADAERETRRQAERAREAAEVAARERDPARCTLTRIEIPRLPAPYVERLEDMPDAEYAREVAHDSLIGNRLINAFAHNESPIAGAPGRFITCCPACPGENRDDTELVYACSTPHSLDVRCITGCCTPDAIALAIRQVVVAYETAQVQARAAARARAEQEDLERMREAVSITRLGEIREQAWRLRGLIPDGQLTLLVGESGSGKTFAGIGFGIAIATGRPFCGHQAEQGRVLGVFLDGGLGTIARRFGGLTAGMGASVPELGGRFDIYREPLCITDPASLARFVQYVQRLGYAAIVIDNLSEIRGGGSENDSTVLSEALRPLAHLAQGRLGTRPIAIVLLHHTNAAGDIRGSTAIKQHVDHVLELERASDRPDATITIKPGKMRDARGSASLKLRFEDRGDAIVPVPVDTAPKAVAAEHGDPVRERIVTVLASGPMGSDSLATTIAKQLGVRKASVIAARRALEDDERIAQGDDGLWRLAPECYP